MLDRNDCEGGRKLETRNIHKKKLKLFEVEFVMILLRFCNSLPK